MAWTTPTRLTTLEHDLVDGMGKSIRETKMKRIDYFGYGPEQARLLIYREIPYHFWADWSRQWELRRNKSPYPMIELLRERIHNDYGQDYPLW